MCKAPFAFGVFGYLFIVLGVLSPFVSCVAGTAVGHQIANGPDPTGHSTIFDRETQSGEMPEFWVLQYPTDTPGTAPRLIELSDSDLSNDNWELNPPLEWSQLSFGPWDPSYLDGSKSTRGEITPTGNLKILAGVISFSQIDDTVIRSELIVYPADKPDGWDRWYYIYDMNQDQVDPVSVYRENNTSDWTVEGSIAYGVGGFGIGALIGVVLVILGVVSVIISKNGSEQYRQKY